MNAFTVLVTPALQYMYIGYFQPFSERQVKCYFAKKKSNITYMLKWCFSDSCIITFITYNLSIIIFDIIHDPNGLTSH